MAIINGRNIIVSRWVGSTLTAFAASKSCDIEVEFDQIEKSSPTSGQWREYLVGRKGWRVTVSGLLTNMRTLLMQGASVDLKIQVSDDQSDYVNGSALIKTIKETGTVGNLSQYSIVFTGNGALT